MRKTAPFRRLIFLCAILFVIVSCMNFSYAADQPEGLKIYDSTISFKHFDYTLNPDYTLKDCSEDKIVTTEFKTKVIENEYLKVTLLPEFGGRIISMIYKPTGHELLYQNPVGTPYGIGEGNFYYNWLMVYGGIFPTFPEPEHGKAWGLPWDFKVVDQSADKITVEMSFTDNIDPVQAVPQKFNKGKTDITCVQTITVYSDSSSIDYNIKLVNNRDSAVNYEYWTCTTLAPGSDPGNTVCPPNTEIAVPIGQIQLKADWWAWMGKSEKVIDAAKNVYEYNNLSLLKNWQDMGIGYAYPSMEKDWWGVINLDNNEGILRIADNKNATPGLKFWTWGDKSRNTNPETFGDPSRPYIELWGGNSSEFFNSTQLKPKEVKTWDEYYMPTVGLSKVTNANSSGAVYLDSADDANGNVNFKADVFMTHPGQSYKAELNLKGAETINLLSTDISGDPAKALNLSAAKPKVEIKSGDYSVEMVIKSADGKIVLQAETPYNADDTAAAPASSQNGAADASKPVSAGAGAGSGDNVTKYVLPAVLILILAALLTFPAIKRKKAK